MTRSRSIILSLTLALTLVLGLAACSGAEAAPDEGEAVAADTTAESEAERSEGGIDGEAAADGSFQLFGEQDPGDAYVITVDGQVFSADGQKQPEGNPTAGDVQTFRETLYAVNDSGDGPEGDPLGYTANYCVLTTTEAMEDAEERAWVCTQQFVLDDRGEISATSAYTDADPLDDQLAITGGTEEFASATGPASFEAVPIPGENVGNSLYTFDLDL